MDEDRGRPVKEERARRLAAAMRDNLRKRKAQERARQEQAQPLGAEEAAGPGEGSR